jgi:hypothetical protein
MMAAHVRAHREFPRLCFVNRALSRNSWRPNKRGVFRRRGSSARLGGMRDNEFTKILGWPGYRVYRHEIDEAAKTLRRHLRVRSAGEGLESED